MTHLRTGSRAPTIKDVARHAGVSAMTVSRVCNPRSDVSISDETRRRVLDSVRALGYSPDVLAQSVRLGRARTIGFYNGYRGILAINDDFLRSIFDGLQEESTRLSQDLLLFYAPEHTRPLPEIVQELTTRKVDGVVFLPSAGDEDLARLLAASNRRVVAIAQPVPGLPTIVAQDADGSRRLAEHLHARGHRRVLYRKSADDLVSATRRYDAFMAAARALGMDVTTMVPELAYDDVGPREREAIRQCRQSGTTAIVGWHDSAAMKALIVCREEGLRVPDDIAIAGFDGLPLATCPPGVTLTTVVVDWTGVSRLAVERIVNGPDDEFGRESELAVECPLRIGNTT